MLLKASLPVLKIFMEKVLRLSLEDGREGLRLCKEGIFKEVDAMLEDGRKYLLNTDEPTYIDVAYAALAAVMVLPEG